MHLFGKKPPRPQYPANTAPAPSRQWGEVLRDDFSVAAFGNYFRTLTFQKEQPADLGYSSEWWEARAVSPGEWMIKHVEVFRHALGHKQEKHRILMAQPISFLAAVEKLALYESQQEGFGRTANPDEAAELGDKYLKNFARREGLVFDSDGSVHVTANGVIVSNGIFDENAEKDAQAAFSARVQKLNSGDIPEISLNIDEWRRRKDALQVFDMILADMAKVMERIHEAEGNNYSHAGIYQHAFRGQAKTLGPEGVNRVQSIRNLYGLASPSPYARVLADNPDLSMAVTLFNISSFLWAAAHTSLHVDRKCSCRADFTGCTQDNAQDLLDRSKKMLEAKGYGAEAERIVFLQYYALKDKMRVKHSDGTFMLDKIISYMGMLKGALKADIGLIPPSDVKPAEMQKMASGLLLPPAPKAGE